MKFGIQVEERYCRTVIVEADSLAEAQEKAEEALRDGKVNLDYDDYSGYGSTPAPRWEGKPIPDDEDISIYDIIGEE